MSLEQTKHTIESSTLEKAQSMSATAISKLLNEIRELEDEVAEQLHKRADELRYKIKDGKILFEREVLSRHRALKVSVIRYIAKARPMVILTAPVIYSLIIPFVLLDAFVTFYQHICFPVYKIPTVKRKDYLVFDRVKLGYLNNLEKLNCAYCTYGNGIIAYTQEVAARTEQYWCPIKHAKKMQAQHSHYHLFTDFGDGEQYREKLKEVQKDFD